MPKRYLQQRGFCDLPCEGAGCVDCASGLLDLATALIPSRNRSGEARKKGREQEQRIYIPPLAKR